MLVVEESHPRRRRSVALAIGAALLVAAAVVAATHGGSPKRLVVIPAATTTVSCGMPITTSIVVGNDLSCPPTAGAGLVVGASGIIINLNGHTIAGGPSAGTGIRNNSFSGVTIENGTVADWNTDDVYVNGTANKVTNIRASGASQGIFLETGAAGSSVTGSVSFLNGTGLYIRANNVAVTNTAVRSSVSVGIWVDTGATADVLTTNQAENSGAEGIVDHGTRTTLSGNVANGNGTSAAHDGILSQSDTTAVLKANTANYNTAYGIDAYAGTTDGGGNAAKGNTTASQCRNVACS